MIWWLLSGWCVCVCYWQARISLAAVSRGDIQIHLSSPSGTRSTLLALRPHDSSRNGFHSWPFMSVHYWGESPFGVWTLEIHNEGRYLGKHSPPPLPSPSKNPSSSSSSALSASSFFFSSSFSSSSSFSFSCPSYFSAKKDPDKNSVLYLSC